MTFSVYARSSIAAFCALNTRRLPFPFSRRPPMDRHRPLSPLGDATSSPSAPPSSSEDKDWFADGRDAARQLKLELGIIGGDDARSDRGTRGDESEESERVSARNDALESGRAAALEFLKDMAAAEESEAQNESQAGDLPEGEHGEPKNESLIQPTLKTEPTSKSASSEQPAATVHRQPSPGSSNNCFDLSSRKSHCATVCLVPHPSSAMQAWEQLTAIRRECRDPGFFRWPPHANLLYPFLEPPVASTDEGEDDDADRRRFREELAIHLKRAAERCEPFDVTIESFGTFGGKRRGVLWADPKSRRGKRARKEEEDEEEDAPLIRLHRALQETFPACQDHTARAPFRPHMTVSHYEDVDRARTALEGIQSRWTPVSFHVPEIYVLERQGDGGQFKISATVPLGTGSGKPVQFHDPPVPFPAMPAEEEAWVYEERMAMKERRKNAFGKRRETKAKD